MKPGLTLIELVLALAFTSVIVVTLFTSFFQINRVSQVAETLIDLDTRMSIIHNQLQKDLSGVFVPEQAFELPEKKTEPSKPGQPPQPPKPAPKEKSKPLKNVFYAVNKEGSLSELAFITNNPIRVYDQAENTKVKPRIARVVYRLQEEKEKKGSFRLVRQEGQELDLEKYKPQAVPKIKDYELAEGIKELKCDYTYSFTESEKQGTGKESKEKTLVKYKTLKEWKSGEGPATKEKKLPKIPEFLTVSITLWDNEQEQDRTYHFGYRIANFSLELDEKPPSTQEKEKDKKATDAKTKQAAQKKQVAQKQTQAAGHRAPVISLNEIRQALKDLAPQAPSTAQQNPRAQT